MIKKIFIIKFIIFFSLTFLCRVYAADTTFPAVRLTINQELNEAKSFFEKGKYDSAWTILSRIIREDPTNIDINLLMLQVANKTGRVNQSLAIMERLVSMHPNDVKLRQELAKGYANVGDRQSAQTELENIKDIDPSLATPGMEFDIARRSKVGETRWDRFQVAGRLNVGILWDSNVNNGIDDLDITIGNLPLKMDEGTEKTNAIGQYINASINGGYKLGEDSSWWLVGDINAFGKNYYIDVPANQYLGWGRVGLGLRHISTENVFDLRLRVENSFYEPEEYMTSSGIEGTWINASIQNWQIITKAGVDTRVYMEQDNKDGNYWYAGTYLRYLWGDNSTNSIMFGARAIGAGTREQQYSYEGFEALLRVSFSPTEKLDIAPFIAYREQIYHDPATQLSNVLGEDNRYDQVFLAGLYFTWHWTEYLATELGWQYTNNNSNSDFYRYDQHQINLGMVFSF